MDITIGTQLLVLHKIRLDLISKNGKTLKDLTLLASIDQVIEYLKDLEEEDRARIESILDRGSELDQMAGEDI